MDATDFGSIYQRYAPDVPRFTLYLCGNRADAEDILSETFIRQRFDAADHGIKGVMGLEDFVTKKDYAGMEAFSKRLVVARCHVSEPSTPQPKAARC